MPPRGAARASLRTARARATAPHSQWNTWLEKVEDIDVSPGVCRTTSERPRVSIHSSKRPKLGKVFDTLPESRRLFLSPYYDRATLHNPAQCRHRPWAGCNRGQITDSTRLPAEPSQVHPRHNGRFKLRIQRYYSQVSSPRTPRNANTTTNRNS